MDPGTANLRRRKSFLDKLPSFVSQAARPVILDDQALAGCDAPPDDPADLRDYLRRIELVTPPCQGQVGHRFVSSGLSEHTYSKAWSALETRR
jgi:hypothetical protein